MRRYGKPVGWRNESHRHYLAAKGIKTNRYFRKLKDSDVITVWHGTRDKSAKKILKEGLKTAKGPYHDWEFDSGGRVHLAPHPLTAVHHAERGPERDFPDSGDEPALLKVTVPKQYIIKPKESSFPPREVALDYLRNQFDRFDERPEHVKEAMIDSIEINPIGTMDDEYRGYEGDVEGDDFILQYELVSDRDIPPEFIRKVDWDKSRRRAIRRRALR